MSVQTLKSASQPRTNVGVSNNQALARLNGHFSALCGASNPDIQNDVYGRNVPNLTIDMRGAPECDPFMPPGQSSMNHITRENLERPYIAIAPEGARGAGDLMGVGRDVMPQDLYGTGIRGNFVRYGQPGLRIPTYSPNAIPPPISFVYQNSHYPPTHDTTSEYYLR
jgi:hypothetical protein